MKRLLRKIRIWKFTSRLSIKARLLATFLVAMVAVFAFGTVSLYLKTCDLVERETISTLHGLLEQMDVNINGLFYRIEDSCFRLYTDLSFTDIFRRDAQNYTYKQQFLDYYSIIDNYNANRTNRYIKDVRFYFRNEAFYLKLPCSAFLLADQEEKTWYSEVMGKSSSCWAGYYEAVDENRPEQTEYRLSCFRPVLQGNRNVGCFEMQLNLEYIKDYVRDMQDRLGGEVYVMTNDGIILASSNDIKPGIPFLYRKTVSDMVASGSDTADLDRNGQQEQLLISKKTDNYIVATIVTNRMLRSHMGGFLPYAAAVGIGMTLLGLAFCMLLSKSITGRIEMLSQFMKQISLEGTELAPVSGDDEITELVRSYNEMMVTSRGLIHQVYEVSLAKKDMELRLLQAQINPHFLYNTLDSINWMANRRNAEDISNMTLLLAKFFRLSLSKGKEIIPIRDEIEHVRIYLEIMRIRFDDDISYDIEVADEIQNHRIVKLVLQPIIENAVLHGLMEKDDPGGTIRITGIMEEDCIRIVVEDDGIGMEQEEVAHMLTDSERPGKGGFGLKNVNDRLQLNYGEKYGLRIMGMPGLGTIVAVKIPIQ